MRQSFAFTDIVQGMTVTQTNLGITERNVLITLPSGGIMALPRPFFNARRYVLPVLRWMLLWLLALP
eukprot:m.128168 g.128168  ORF g.128168 m.128168 type:complete len:67 (+) comp15823_c2_seq3:2398-2598(+)